MKLQTVGIATDGAHSTKERLRLQTKNIRVFNGSDVLYYVLHFYEWIVF